MSAVWAGVRSKCQIRVTFKSRHSRSVRKIGQGRRILFCIGRVGVNPRQLLSFAWWFVVATHISVQEADRRDKEKQPAFCQLNEDVEIIWRCSLYERLKTRRHHTLNKHPNLPIRRSNLFLLSWCVCSSSRPPKKARLCRLWTQISVFDYEPTSFTLAGRSTSESLCPTS